MSELGEVAINVKEEGVDEALEGIDGEDAEMAAPSGDEDEGMGGLGDIFGAMSAKLTAILGFVAFLATLKPIKELFSGLQRLFSVAILPLVALLTAFLRPILQRLLRFIGTLDFDNLMQDLLNRLQDFLGRLPDLISEAIDRVVDFDVTGGFREFFFGGSGAVQTQTGVGDESGMREGPFGTRVVRDSPGERIFLSLGWLDEQSNTSLDEGVVETNAEQTQKNAAGSE